MMRLLQVVLLASAMAWMMTGHAASCPAENMADIPVKSLRCDFYSGTAAYRAQQYATAAGYWQKVIERKAAPDSALDLLSYAYNNLGYLSFFGIGVAVDQPKALRYWRQAMKSGDAEPVYHLCHAHADQKQPTYNHALALQYCPEALRRYQAIAEKSPSDLDIIGQLQRYIDQL